MFREPTRRCCRPARRETGLVRKRCHGCCRTRRATRRRPKKAKILGRENEAMAPPYRFLKGKRERGKKERKGTVDERNRGMSSRVRTCSLTPCAPLSRCMHPARFLSGPGKREARSWSLVRSCYFCRRNRRDCRALNERERGGKGDCRYRFPSGSEQFCIECKCSFHGG